MRTRIGLVCCGVVLSALALPAVARAGDVNWALVTVTAGPSGLDQPYVEISYAARATHDGPVVTGIGWAVPGDAIIIVYADGREGLTASTTQSHGGIRYHVPVPGPTGDASCCASFVHSDHLSPGQSISFLFFVTNTVLHDIAYEVTQNTDATVALTTGGGAAAMPIAEPTNSGSGASVGPAGYGNTATYATESAVGLVGAVSWSDCQGSCHGVWRSPDRTGEWSVEAALHLAGWSRGTVFAGPAGDWSWTWTGAAVTLGVDAPVIGAWAPIGDAWTDFR